MAKEKEIIEIKKEEFKEVIGILEAEKLQKEGLKLISVKATKDGKLYKFLKG